MAVEAHQQHAHIAEPEEALLDLLYLTPESNSGAYLDQLRLQEMEKLDLETFRRVAVRFGTPRVVHAVRKLAALVSSERGTREGVPSGPCTAKQNRG